MPETLRLFSGQAVLKSPKEIDICKRYTLLALGCVFQGWRKWSLLGLEIKEQAIQLSGSPLLSIGPWRKNGNSRASVKIVILPIFSLEIEGCGAFPPHEKYLVLLKICIAAGEIGAISVIYLAWGAQPARGSPSLNEVGEVHEAQASWLTKEEDEVAAERELLSAAFAYKTAADKTREFYPSNGLRFDRYKAFGGYFEMAWTP